MIALLQRVHHASVTVSEKQIASIQEGLLVFIGIEKNDTKEQANKLLNRLIAYRVFSDEDDKMNLSLKDINGGLLLVPQFTLAANTNKGLRPSFNSAAPPEEGKALFDYMCDYAQQIHPTVSIGEFGADMQVSLTNNGPVTFWLQSPPENQG